jgi:hypothetical protein
MPSVEMTLPYHYTSYIWPMLAPAAFTAALLVIPLPLHLLLVFTNDAHHWLSLGFSFLIPVAREQEPTFVVASAGLRRVMLRAQSLVVSLSRQTTAPEACTMRTEKRWLTPRVSALEGTCS